LLYLSAFKGDKAINECERMIQKGLKSISIHSFTLSIIKVFSLILNLIYFICFYTSSNGEILKATFGESWVSCPRQFLQSY